MDSDGSHPVSPSGDSERDPGAAREGVSSRPSRRRFLLRLATWGTTLLMVVGIGCLTAVLAARKKHDLAVPPRKLAQVATIKVVPCRHCETLELPTRLEADRVAVLGSEVAGKVEEWLVNEGEAVKAGQRMLRLNTDDIEASLRGGEAKLAAAEKNVAVSEAAVNAAQVGLTQAQRDAASLDLALQSAEAKLKLARREHARTEKLSKDGIATEADLDTAANALTQAELGVATAKDAIARSEVTIQAARARLRQTEAALGLSRARVEECKRDIESLRVSLGKMIISAPFAGRFEEHLVEIGDVVAPGQPLGRLYDMAHLRAAVDIPDCYAPFLDLHDDERLQSYLKVAMPGAVQDLSAAVLIPGLPKLTGGNRPGVELPAEIYRVAQAADPLSNTFRVELRLQNPGNALKQGIVGTARITFLRYDAALIIPVKAIQVSEDGPRVLIADKVGGRVFARVRRVEPIRINGDRVLIRGEVQGGEDLIVSGTKGLVDGMEVRVVVADGTVVARTGDRDRARPRSSSPPEPEDDGRDSE